MNKSTFINIYIYFISLLLVISFYSLGNFGFWNIFGIKQEINILLVILLIPITIIILLNNLKKIYLEPLLLLLLYSLISLVIIDIYSLSNIKLLLTFSIVAILLSINFKYTNFIIKGIITIAFLFSLIGIFLFLYYQLNQEILNGLDRVFKSYETYVDLSYLPLHQKFGFVIETAEKNFFSLEYIRSRSYVSEPSLTLHIFFASAILSLLYSDVIKKMGFIIFFFCIVLIYPGSAILSLIFSIFYVVGNFFIKLDEEKKAVMIITMIIFAYIVIYLTNISLLDFLTPESKTTSLTSRLLPIKSALDNIFSNLFFNDSKILAGSFIGFPLVLSGIIPIFGILLSIYLWYIFLSMSIKVYKKEKLFSILIVGLLIQIFLFSSGGWVSLSGYMMLSLIYIKLKNEVESNENRLETIYISESGK